MNEKLVSELEFHLNKVHEIGKKLGYKNILYNEQYV